MSKDNRKKWGDIFCYNNHIHFFLMKKVTMEFQATNEKCIFKTTLP